jgi:hypothetical protein
VTSKTYGTGQSESNHRLNQWSVNLKSIKMEKKKADEKFLKCLALLRYHVERKGLDGCDHWASIQNFLGENKGVKTHPLKFEEEIVKYRKS